jgi:membrane fusion protein (multidrug efflux system)
MSERAPAEGDRPKPWRGPVPGVLVLAVLVAAGCGGDAAGGGDTARAERPGGRGRGGAPAAEAIAVRTADAFRQPMAEVYSTSTTLRADRSATVTARTRGRIEALLVEEGDRVREGQPLARLEDVEQRIAAERAEATLEIRQREHERLSRLLEQDLVSENEVEAARRALEDARHAADLADLELSRTVVRAPFGGTVVRRQLDVGATVTDGTAVYDLADLDPLYADVRVPEAQVAALAPGQTVRLVSDAGGGAVEGEIERIAPTVDAETGTVKVTVAVPGAGALRPGAFVRAEIVTDVRQDALVVERTALVADGSRWHLFRVAEDGKQVEQLQVRPGYEQDVLVEVREVVRGTPLAPGDEVVVVGASALSDGARIEVVTDGVAAAPDEETDATAKAAAGPAARG